VAALSAAGVFEWHRYVLDQEKRASPSWRSVPEVVQSETDELDLTLPQTETETETEGPTVAPPAGPAEGSTQAVASHPSSVGPSLKKRSGVATLFFSERELVSLDSDGKPVKKEEKLFAR
jgi:hypothetical protein